MDVMSSRFSKVGRWQSLLGCALIVVLLLVSAAFVSGCSGSHDGEAKVPISYSDSKGKNYQDVELQFKNAGFTDVTVEPMGDLITGWLNSENAVEEVTIDGSQKYSASSWFKTDAKVVIRYHSFRKSSSSNDDKSSTSESTGSSVENASAASSASSGDAANGASSDSSQDSSGSSEAVRSEDENAQKQERQEQLADYSKNLPGSELVPACETLKAEGISFTLKHDVTWEDMTSAYEYGDFDNGDMVITDARVNGDSLTLWIKSAAVIAEEEAAQATREALEDKLNVISAWWAVRDYGEDMYPYGFKLHYMLGVLAEEAEDDSTWFLKAECDVTNQYGAKMRGLNCEARVTGTDESPQVIYFNVY